MPLDKNGQPVEGSANGREGGLHTSLHSPVPESIAISLQEKARTIVRFDEKASSGD